MRRISRDVQYEELVKQLTTGDSPVFSDIWRLLLFAATLGFSCNRKKKLEKVESNKSMPSSYIGIQCWPGLLYVMAMVDSGTHEVLLAEGESQDDLVSLFEEYANGGLAILSDALISGDEISDFISLFSVSDESEIDSPDVSDLI